MLEKNRITIFTPTYNRAYVLPCLYDSLCRQTDKNFCWLIVDDGSTDNTYELVERWKKENRVDITYIYQENAGKPQAHNIGVENTRTELFACVDSDDYLADVAVERILKCWKEHLNVIGILCRKGLDLETAITTWKGNIMYATLYEAIHLYKLRGDTMLVFRTDVINRFRFPKFADEKFIPESYLYDLIDQEGKMYFLPEILYVCKYFPDGYTANMRRVNANNPQGYLAYIRQRLELDKTFLSKIMDTIRYVAIKCVQKDGRLLKDAVYPFLAILMFIPGWIFYRKAYFEGIRRN